MQNAVEVACSSPPAAMNATRPTAQAVQAADHDPFGLVLHKASERIDNDKQYDCANNSSESKAMDNTHRLDTTSKKKVSVQKNESEVEKTDELQKVDKAENKDELVKSSEKENVNDPSKMVFGYTSLIAIEMNNLESVEVEQVVTSVGAVAEAVQPENLLQIASTSITQPKGEVAEPTLPLGETEPVSTLESSTSTEEAKNSNIEAEALISFSKTSKSDNKVIENGNTVPEPESIGPKIKMDNSEKTNVPTGNTIQGAEVNSTASKYQKVAPTVEVIPGKINKPSEVMTNQQTAPPDIPDGSTGVAASTTVQTATQINEPARLAEAPKNEVMNQIANQLDQMVKTNRTSVRMQLYPEELGHIDLRITTTKDGINVTMTTEKASTQQVLKSDMDMLKQNIEQAGIQLSNLNINQGHNSNRQQSFDHRQNLSKSSYPGKNSDNPNPTTNEQKVHLTSSIVDYKI